MVGLNAAPMVLFAVDSIAVEWDTPTPPKDLDQMTEEDRREYAKISGTEQPTLLISGPFGRLRIFPPPSAVQAIQGGNLEPLILALALHQIDRLPWPFLDVSDQDRCIRPLTLRP